MSGCGNEPELSPYPQQCVGPWHPSRSPLSLRASTPRAGRRSGGGCTETGWKILSSKQSACEALLPRLYLPVSHSWIGSLQPRSPRALQVIIRRHLTWEPSASTQVWLRCKKCCEREF